MTLVIIESVLFLLILIVVFYYKTLSRPQLGEGELGPFTIVYIKDLSTPWTTAKKIKEIQEYLKSKDLMSNTYVRYYMTDPSKSKNKKIPSVIGAVIGDQMIPKVEEPFEVTTLTKRYVAYAANENRLLGMNPMVLYPRLFAYMDVMNYKPENDRYLEIFHMSDEQDHNGFGEGFYTRICGTIRDKTGEELERDSKRKVYDVNNMIFGKRSGFGRS
ncbi:MAG: hypothetical protein U9N81_13860 [Bacillota bacterium]|nr:hypothetical protein [Bacillota bacterium]